MSEHRQLRASGPSFGAIVALIAFGSLMLFVATGTDPASTAAESTNSIPSRTTVHLTGTWVLDTRGTYPRQLDLTGPVQVTGEGQTEDLSVRVAGDGTWTLRLGWVEEH